MPRRRNYEEESDRLERAYEEDALFKEKDQDDLQVIEEVFDRRRESIMRQVMREKNLP